MPAHKPSAKPSHPYLPHRHPSPPPPSIPISPYPHPQFPPIIPSMSQDMFPDIDPDSHLPCLIPSNFPKPILLTDSADLTATKKADIEMYNNQLQILYSLYVHVKTIKSALDIHDRIMAMIPQRRSLLGLSYGPTADKASRSAMFEPVD